MVFRGRARSGELCHGWGRAANGALGAERSREEKAVGARERSRRDVAVEGDGWGALGAERRGRGG